MWQNIRKIKIELFFDFIKTNFKRSDFGDKNPLCRFAANATGWLLRQNSPPGCFFTPAPL
jgi:hypothetical protein